MNLFLSAKPVSKVQIPAGYVAAPKSVENLERMPQSVKPKSDDSKFTPLLESLKKFLTSPNVNPAVKSPVYRIDFPEAVRIEWTYPKDLPPAPLKWFFANAPKLFQTNVKNPNGGEFNTVITQQGEWLGKTDTILHPGDAIKIYSPNEPFSLVIPSNFPEAAPVRWSDDLIDAPPAEIPVGVDMSGVLTMSDGTRWMVVFRKDPNKSLQPVGLLPLVPLAIAAGSGLLAGLWGGYAVGKPSVDSTGKTVPSLAQGMASGIGQGIGSSILWIGLGFLGYKIAKDKKII